MQEANQRAVNEIIAPQRLHDVRKIDLHGLLVAEAVEATKQFAKNAIANGKFDSLEVITGAGHHSDSAKGPVIKPAIIKLCQEENWKLEADGNNEGLFTLFIKESANAAVGNNQI
jgi:DNA-nicking Smr family endonuclease